MALNDRPQVDRYSKNANNSELAIQTIFSQEQDFICRQPIPDKGCDFQIELIREDGGATNRHIFVQVKSVEQLNLLVDGQTISYNFETSRLGYLMESPAALILIYVMATGIVYYGHVHEIAANLDAAKEAPKWREQDSVQLHIPVTNRLDKATAVSLHQYYSELFDRLQYLHQSQGLRYGIPVVGELPPGHIDLQNPDQVKAFIMQNSAALMTSHQLGLAVKLLLALPPPYLESEVDLLLVAAMVYCEVGRHYDSQNYIRKLKSREPVPETYKYLIPYAELKNKLALDQISIHDFMQGLSELRDHVNNPQNKIILDLNILLYEQAAVQFMHPMPDDMYERIQALSDRIKREIADEGGRLLLLVSNIDNLAALINYHKLHQLNELAVLELFRVRSESAELKTLSDKIRRWHEQLHAELAGYYQAGQERKDKLLQASVILVRSRFMIAQEIDLISQYPMLQHLCYEDQQVIQENIAYALTGSDLFKDLHHFANAYLCLCCAIELTLISRGHYRYPDQIDLEGLTKRKKQMETEWDVNSYDLQYPQMAARNKQAESVYGKKPVADMTRMDDKQLHGMAAVIGKAMRLGEQQRANLLFELKTYRSFYRRCGDQYKIRRIPSIVPRRQAYLQPALFVIEHKLTGVSSQPTRHIDQLLDRWGL